MDDFELDDILENALNEFDEEEEEEEEQQRHRQQLQQQLLYETNSSSTINVNRQQHQHHHHHTSESSPSTAAAMDPNSFDDFDQIFDKLSMDETNSIEKLAQEMGVFLKKLETNQNAQESSNSSSSSSSNSSAPSSFQDTMRRTMQNLKQNTRDMENLGDASQQQQQQANGLPDMFNDESFEELMQNLFQKGGNDGQSENNEEQDEEKMVGFLEKIMETLMSPDILQKPMEELRQKYPEWLEANRDKIEQSEYERIQNQYEYSKKICALYEHKKFPECLSELIDLMKGMQSYGQPPEEIVSSLSNADPNGVGGGLPNIPGMPDLGNMDPSNCPVQ